MIQNSDCKQCTESKLGWVHSAQTQGPGCAHCTQNSYCKQCTESKLGWVHSAHTQGTGCTRTAPRLRTHCTQAARTPHAGRRVMAYWAPYRSPLPVVSNRASCHVAARTRTLSHCVAAPLIAIQNLYRNAEAHALRNARRVACAQSNVVARTSALLCCVAACLAAPFHDTKICIATHPRGQAARARYHSPLRAGRLCCSALLAELQPCFAPPACTHSAVSRLGARPALLCLDTIYCIVTQH